MNLTTAAPEALAAALEDAAPRLTARVMDEMYANPWWERRFGERGRRHADQDGTYHLTYVAAALRAGDPGVFTRYATWLRGVLTSRAMCTRHLAENFERLAIAIAGEPWPGRGRAIALLEAGIDALRPALGPARALDDARPAVVEAMRGHGVAARVDDLDYLVSYLTDAMVGGRSSTLCAHVAATTPRQHLAALAAAIDVEAPAASVAAAPHLAAALGAAGEGQA